jgi:hypothetical protein
VALVRTDISEELSASFIRVTRISELGTALAIIINQCMLRRNTKCKESTKKYKWHFHKEELPYQWVKSIIVPIYKKSNETDCNNYHGISLLSTSYKILCNILLSRFNAHMDWGSSFWVLM